MNLKFEVYEDNAGYLHLAIVEDETCVEIIEGWEREERGCLYTALAELVNDPLAYDTDDWSDRLSEMGDHLAEALPRIYTDGLGELIAEITTRGEIMIYPYNMGIAGRRAFGIPTDR